MLNARTLLSSAFLLAWASALPSAESQTRFTAAELDQVVSEWAQTVGGPESRWLVNYDEELGRAKFVFGGSLEAPFEPQTDADWYTLARAYVAEAYPLTGVEDITLFEDRLHFLPLGMAGTTDKMTVRFRQQINGVPVVHGWLNVLMDMDGNLLSVDTTSLPEVANFDTAATVKPQVAYETARATFSREMGLPITSSTAPKLVIDQVVGEDGYRRPVLTWEMEVQYFEAGFDPAGFHYRVDAKSGRLAAAETCVHNFDVSGQVRSLLSPGTAPDVGSNPEESEPMAYLRVFSNQGNVTTDSNGNFNINGASAPLNITVRYNGTFTDTDNFAGSDYVLSTTLTQNPGNVVTMNPNPTNQITAQANSFKWINAMRDWIRSIDPGDNTADFNLDSNVNIDNNCNATYNGSVNFYTPGGGCPNTAYSTVVAHEEGHGLNNRYGSGNGPDGFGEGAADAWALYITDQPILGEGFISRNGNNNLAFCGDCCNGCYGGVHANGQVLMGALWKVRAQLQDKHGQQLGGSIANSLFLAWFNAYNDGQIKTVIRDHWLVLDDNNGNLFDGTPNYGAIDGGFVQQQFPSFGVDFLELFNLTELSDTASSTSSRTVEVEAISLFNAGVGSATLHYSVNSGFIFQTVPMTFMGNLTWRGEIPAIAGPARVDYFVTVEDANGNSETAPAFAQEYMNYRVGVLTTYFSDGFETDLGWTHGATEGADDWQRSADVGLVGTAGKAGDPDDAYKGQNVYGNDLGNGSDGEFESNTDNFLLSPSIDLSAADSPRLRFRRWLTSEEGLDDTAHVRVNGVLSWFNNLGLDAVDQGWVLVDVAIPGAANDPSAQIEFSLETDGNNNRGGWNIDEVEIYTLEGAGADCEVNNYCVSKLGSAGNLPFIFANGTASNSVDDFQVGVFDLLPFKAAIHFWGFQTTNVPFLGGTLCVNPPLARGPILPTDALGIAIWPIDVENDMPGTERYYQIWGRDPADAFGAGLSGGLRVLFCE